IEKQVNLNILLHGNTNFCKRLLYTSKHFIAAKCGLVLPSYLLALKYCTEASFPSRLARPTQAHRGGGFKHLIKQALYITKLDSERKKLHPPSLWNFGEISSFLLAAFPIY
ncbi:hypothetical protein F2P56_010734, partial [Juglans regia]